ncbi:MAG: hypothetical protein A3E38_02165 [Candidatus Moranbacteria bacterium RIFCSPHIGHO2_12_FULL_54_9]|nr:MAG: hypothetical protein A2878_01935 [Candidatus Moranbacteria bacterium RIFCSPHIGHO2_01_FULL_54_31]OGI25268.1 MAG: hypothetical protein A3E38_02165 [Candidatus Moranbacteria bacterium RIFCSPHIGHO2_12_FULL_54_9]
MKFKADFFKTAADTAKTLRDKLVSLLRTAQHSVASGMADAPKIADARLWFRSNSAKYLGRIGSIISGIYARLVTRGEYTKRDLIILFILAILLGIALKSAAVQTITIGYDDYTLRHQGTLYDLNAIQRKLTDEGGAFVSGSAGAGNVCTQ